MRITITARHCEIAADLRARARDLMDRLGKVAGRPHDGRVTFEADHGEALAEVRLHTARGVVYVGSAGGPDHRTALDRAASRVRRQLERRTPPRRRTAAREPR